MSSHIPLPSKARRSKSAARSSSSIAISASANKLRRSNSCDKLMVPTRSLSSVAGKKSVATPLNSTSHQIRSMGLTPQYGLTRSNSNLTPAGSSRSRSRSPFRSGSEMRDKKFVNDLFQKVCNYLEEVAPEIEQPAIMLKPPHLSVPLFIHVLSVLLQKISGPFKCDNTNYKESTINIMKALKYPHSISISTLKTVGAAHSWPQIVNIWSWLVDLNNVINQFTSPKLDDLNSRKEHEAIKYLCKRFEVYNLKGDVQQVDKEFVETFGQLLNVDEEKNQKLENEVACLKRGLEEKSNVLEKLQLKYDMLLTELKTKQDQIEQVKAFNFNEEQQLEDLNYEIESLKKRKNKLAGIIEAKHAKIANLKETISAQPCSLEKKKQIEKSIIELEQSIKLKYEQIKEKRLMKDEIENQVLEQKRKIKQEVSNFNIKLMKLTLSDPEMKKFKLNEESCTFEAFKEELQITLEQLKNHKKDSERILKIAFERLTEINAKTAKLAKKLNSLEKANEELFEAEKAIKAQLEACSNRIETMSENREKEKRDFLKKMEDLKASDTGEDLDGQILELKKLKKTNEEALNKRLRESYQFFVKLRSIVLSNVVNMNKIRTELCDFLTEKLTKASEDQQAILDALAELQSLGDEETKDE